MQRHRKKHSSRCRFYFLETKYAQPVTLHPKELFDFALFTWGAVSRIGNVLSASLHPANNCQQSYAIKGECFSFCHSFWSMIQSYFGLLQNPKLPLGFRKAAGYEIDILTQLKSYLWRQRIQPSLVHQALVEGSSKRILLNRLQESLP